MQNKTKKETKKFAVQIEVNNGKRNKILANKFRNLINVIKNK